MSENQTGEGQDGQNAVEKHKPVPPKTSEKLKTNGETLCVGCKIPQGIALRLFDMVDSFEPVMGGGSRPTKRAEEVGRIVLKGWNDTPDLDSPIIQARKPSYAITRDVPREAFEAWWEKNEKSSLVVNKLIIAAANEERLRAKIKELDRELSPHEVVGPIDPSMRKNPDGLMVAKDPRFPRGQNGQSLIQKGDRENNSISV